MDSMIKHPSSERAAALATGLLAALCLCVCGCDTIDAGPFISDGELNGINGWDVKASVDVSPNRGSLNTPVTISVEFSRGAAHVDAIEMEDRGFQPCRLLKTWRNQFTKVSATRWSVPHGALFLTGNDAALKFIALNSNGSRIAIGEVQINGGCSADSKLILDGARSSGIGSLKLQSP